jgi:hypothetical protein
MTTNNLQEVSELLGSEYLAYKKCCNYVSTCKDAVLKEKLGTYANNHRIRFEALLSYLNQQG